MSNVGPDFKVTLPETFCKTKNFHTFSAVYLYEAVKRPIRKGEFLYLDEKAAIELAETGRIREGRFAIHNEKWANEVNVEGLELAVDITEIEVGLSGPNLEILLNCPLTAGHKDVYNHERDISNSAKKIGFHVCNYDKEYSSPCISASTVEFVRRKMPVRSVNKTWSEQVNHLPHYQNISSALSIVLLHSFERLETGKCVLDMCYRQPKEGYYECVSTTARTPETVLIEDMPFRVTVTGGYHGHEGLIRVQLDAPDVHLVFDDEEDEEEEDKRDSEIGVFPCISAGPSTTAQHQELFVLPSPIPIPIWMNNFQPQPFLPFPQPPFSFLPSPPPPEKEKDDH